MKYSYFFFRSVLPEHVICLDGIITNFHYPLVEGRVVAIHLARDKWILMVIHEALCFYQFVISSSQEQARLKKHENNSIKIPSEIVKSSQKARRRRSTNTTVDLTSTNTIQVNYALKEYSWYEWAILKSTAGGTNRVWNIYNSPQMGWVKVFLQIHKIHEEEIYKLPSSFFAGETSRLHSDLRNAFLGSTLQKPKPEITWYI